MAKRYKLHKMTCEYPIGAEFIIIKKAGEHPNALNLQGYSWDIKVERDMKKENKAREKALKQMKPGRFMGIHAYMGIVVGKVEITGKRKANKI